MKYKELRPEALSPRKTETTLIRAFPSTDNPFEKPAIVFAKSGNRYPDARYPDMVTRLAILESGRLPNAKSNTLIPLGQMNHRCYRRPAS